MLEALRSMTASGRMARCTEKANSKELMAMFTLATGPMTYFTVKVSTSGLMAVSTKEIGTLASQTATEFSFKPME